MRQFPLGKFALSVLAVGLTGFGCESNSNNGNATPAAANERGGKVLDRSQGQTINPDGSAVRTRTQVRQAPSGAMIQETQTEKREVIDPADSGVSDPTNGDPGEAR